MIAKRKQKYLVPKQQILFLKDLGSNRTVYQEYGWKNTGTLFKSHLISYALEYIREAIDEERAYIEKLPADDGMPDKAEIEEVLDDVLQNIRKNALSDDIAKQGARAEVLLSMLMGSPQAAGMYKDMFGDRGLKGYMDDRYGD